MYRKSAKPKLGSLLATRVSWDDLTLPLAELTELKQLSEQLAATRQMTGASLYGPNPWAATRLLFWGPAGMGKILAARLIANELDLAVWQVPSASLVERYIGETEKNLDRVFDRAGQRGWILFFDEADALFGKRTGVRPHNSRYANQEISYLLQRAEAYRGIVILSTQTKPRFSGRLLRRFEKVMAFF